MTYVVPKSKNGSLGEEEHLGISTAKREKERREKKIPSEGVDMSLEISY